MSFVKTLATLAAGFAVAKGYEKYKDLGGMAGVREQMQENPAVVNATDQMGAMLEKAGVPGGGDNIRKMMDQWLGSTEQAGQAAAAGLGGLMSAIAGATAGGADQAGQLMDALTGKTAVSSAMQDNAKLMIRAMIQAAKADGEIDMDERARILEQLGDIGPEERAFVEAEMAKPVDIQSLASETGDQMKSQVYAMSLMAIRVDKASEAAYLDGLATALGLSDEARAAIHRSMGLT
jgi:uncharacterized membrane protein YebE (DUF533 family)